MKRGKTVKDKKTQPIQIRLSNDQRAAFQNAADEIGLDLSNWIRMICLAAIKKPRASE